MCRWNLFETNLKIYITNKTDIYYIDVIWSLDILFLEDYGPENIRGYKYDLVVTDIFSKFGWTVPFEKMHNP